MALSQDRSGRYYRPGPGQAADSIAGGSPLIATGQTIFKGALVSNNAAGFLVEATDAANDVFVGIAIDGTQGTTTSADGAISSRVIRQGEVLLTLTGAAQTMVDQDVFVVDDETVALAATTTNDVRVGKVIELGPTANTVWVAFNTAQ